MYDVCIADDEILIQQSVTARLRESGAPARVLGCADNAESALTLYRSARPDIFFVDINMPGLDGLGLVRRIREEDPGCTTKFIVITGYDDFAHLREAIQSGVMDYLKKPISTEEFNDVLAQAARQIQQERKTRAVQSASLQDGSVYYEDYIAGGKRNLDGGVLLAVHAPSAEAFSGDGGPAGSFAGALSTLTEKDRLAKPGLALRFQHIPNLRLWHCPDKAAGRAVPRSDLALALRPFLERTRFSIVYAYPDMEPLELLAERLEQSLNIRFIHPGLIECIRRPLPSSRDTGLLDYALENGRAEEAAAAISALLSKARGNVHSNAHSIEAIGELSPLYRQIVLLLINKYISHNIPLPGSLKLELSPFALCRFPTLDALGAFLADAASTLAGAAGAEGRKGELIQGVIEYLRQHYRDNISLNFLASQFFVTPPYLSRRFKEKTGRTFVEYLEEIRLEKAEEYLAASDAKITGISEQVGYLDPNYFAKVFKKKRHLSPSDYRAAHRP